MCQQKDEKHMPTYSQGTFMPLMSPLMCVSTDCSRTGMLFRFQPEFAYSCAYDTCDVHPHEMKKEISLQKPELKDIILCMNNYQIIIVLCIKHNFK